MIVPAGRTSAAALVLVLVPATAGMSAGARPARAPVSLTAVPARLTLTGSTNAVVRVTNSGTKRVVVDVSRAGFALDLRGRPRIVRRDSARSAAPWLRFRPARFSLDPRASVSVVVASTLPRRAEPGDHDAVVLLRTHPLKTARVAVRVRMGVVVIVRAPGKVVRHLELRALHVTRRGRRRALELVVANRGNISESVRRARVVVSRARTGRRLVTLVSGSRELRPRTSGMLEFGIRRKAHGRMIVRAVVPAAPGRAQLRRTYRIRL